MKACRRSRGTTPLFLTLPLGEDEWSTSHSGYITPLERTLLAIEQEARWTPGLVWTFGEKEISCPCWELNPGLSSLWPITDEATLTSCTSRLLTVKVADGNALATLSGDLNI